MAIVRLMGGLRRFGEAEARCPGATVGQALRASGIPPDLVAPGGQLNPDLVVLRNGRNVAFLAGLDTPVEGEDRVAVFLHGARGFPGG